MEITSNKWDDKIQGKKLNLKHTTFVAFELFYYV